MKKFEAFVNCPAQNERAGEPRTPVKNERSYNGGKVADESRLPIIILAAELANPEHGSDRKSEDIKGAIGPMMPRSQAAKIT